MLNQVTMVDEPRVPIFKYWMGAHRDASNRRGLGWDGKGGRAPYGWEPWIWRLGLVDDQDHRHPPHSKIFSSIEIACDLAASLPMLMIVSGWPKRLVAHVFEPDKSHVDKQPWVTEGSWSSQCNRPGLALQCWNLKQCSSISTVGGNAELVKLLNCLSLASELL